jgi:hypothetical protein
MSTFQNLLYTMVQDIKPNKRHDNKFHTFPDSRNFGLSANTHIQLSVLETVFRGKTYPSHLRCKVSLKILTYGKLI